MNMCLFNTWSPWCDSRTIIHGTDMLLGHTTAIINFLHNWIEHIFIHKMLVQKKGWNLATNPCFIRTWICACLTRGLQGVIVEPSFMARICQCGKQDTKSSSLWILACSYMLLGYTTAIINLLHIWIEHIFIHKMLVQKKGWNLATNPCCIRTWICACLTCGLQGVIVELPFMACLWL